MNRVNKGEAPPKWTTQVLFGENNHRAEGTNHRAEGAIAAIANLTLFRFLTKLRSALIYGYLWLFMVIYGYLWLFMVIYGYLWLFMVVLINN